MYNRGICGKSSYIRPPPLEPSSLVDNGWVYYRGFTVYANTVSKIYDNYGGREGHRARRPPPAIGKMRHCAPGGDAAQCGEMRQVVRQRAVRCGTVRYDAALCGEMRQVVRQSAVRCGTVRGDVGTFGNARLSAGRCGTIYSEPRVEHVMRVS